MRWGHSEQDEGENTHKHVSSMFLKNFPSYARKVQVLESSLCQESRQTNILSLKKLQLEVRKTGPKNIQAVCLPQACPRPKIPVRFTQIRKKTFQIQIQTLLEIDLREKVQKWTNTKFD